MVKQSTEVGVPSIPWSDPVIWSSAILFLWLLATTVFSVVYKPTRQGKKIAWLVTVSFLFLLVELMIVLQFGHGTPVAEVAFVSCNVYSTASLAPPLPENSDRKAQPLDQSISEFLGRVGRGVRGFSQCLRSDASKRRLNFVVGLREEFLQSTSIAPHPPTPSPREFGLRLIGMVKFSGPNSRGEGEQEFGSCSSNLHRHAKPRRYSLACASGLYFGGIL